MHPNHHHIAELNGKELREFAFVIGGITAGIFGLFVPWLFEYALPLWPWIVFGVFAVWGLFLPTTLRPVYRIWMRFGILMSLVTNPIIMALIFYIVITPIGVVRRAVGNDPMRREMSESETYRLPSRKAPTDYLKRPF